MPLLYNFVYVVIWSDLIWRELLPGIMQFTIPGGRHAVHHVGLLQKAGAGRVLRAAAAATSASIEAKIFARIVLRNLEHHQSGTSTWTHREGASSNESAFVEGLHGHWPVQNLNILACADSDWRSLYHRESPKAVKVTKWKPSVSLADVLGWVWNLLVIIWCVQVT
jgi:hypothetical protein